MYQIVTLALYHLLLAGIVIMIYYLMYSNDYNL